MVHDADDVEAALVGEERELDGHVGPVGPEDRY
jgi:hypothetical protein